MKKIFILVEGQTEEKFSKELLSPYLRQKEIFLQPVIVKTKVVKDGQNFKGGLSSYTKTRSDLHKLLRDTSAYAVSTMFDYYGLPQSFPGRTEPQGNTSLKRVEFVENALAKDISNNRFIPFLTLHEFEGLLFSSPEDMAKALPGSHDLVSSFQEIRRQYGSPEEINDDPQKAPSKRIVSLFPTYQKPTFGVSIASRIGLQKIREECPHFSNWLTKLEQL